MSLFTQPLVIASHNKDKVVEIAELIAPLGIRAISATEAGIEEPEETGDSFAENAALKAVHAMDTTGLPSLADDSGLVIPAIGGAPGIYSARWAGPTKDFTIAFARIKAELAALLPSPCRGEGGERSEPGGGKSSIPNQPTSPLPNPPPYRGREFPAYFISTLALSLPGESPHLFEGRIDGHLTFPPRGTKGFGYDPIFIPEGYPVTFAEFDPAEKNRISHRARAFAKFLDYLKAAS